MLKERVKEKTVKMYKWNRECGGKYLRERLEEIWVRGRENKSENMREKKCKRKWDRGRVKEEWKNY